MLALLVSVGEGGCVYRYTLYRGRISSFGGQGAKEEENTLSFPSDLHRLVCLRPPGPQGGREQVIILE